MGIADKSSSHPDPLISPFLKSDKMTETAAAPAKAPKATKAKKPKTTPSHPTYQAMAKAAIAALKERTGSSRQAILKYIMANYGLGNDTKAVNNLLKVGLKNGLKNPRPINQRRQKPPRKPELRKPQLQRRQQPRPRNPRLPPKNLKPRRNPKPLKSLLRRNPNPLRSQPPPKNPRQPRPNLRRKQPRLRNKFVSSIVYSTHFCIV